MPSLSFMLRSCDSRNLNLSPFCNTSATSLVMWQTNMEETYGNTTTSYVSGISGPMRLKYPRATAKKELIHSLTKVLIWYRIYDDNFDKQGDQWYNAYEKDIALVNIYFGDSTVLGKTFPTNL